MDQDLLDRLRRQDAAAFELLVREHQSVVMGLTQSLGLRGADQDDAAAEAFAAVYRALPRFEGRSQLSTWIYQIAYRVVLKVRTRRRRTAAAAEPIYDDSAASPAAPVGDAAERAETAAALWAAVESLDPKQSAAVDLFYRQQFSVEKIADVMQCPTGTVKTLLFRARAKLRTVLAAQEAYP